MKWPQAPVTTIRHVVGQLQLRVTCEFFHELFCGTSSVQLTHTISENNYARTQTLEPNANIGTSFKSHVVVLQNII